MAELDGREILRLLAIKLRSKAKWESYYDHYATELDSAKNAAKQEIYDGLAAEIEELLLPDPRPFCVNCGREGTFGLGDESITHHWNCPEDPDNKKETARRLAEEEKRILRNEAAKAKRQAAKNSKDVK